jgi:hypothetical protein
MSGSVGLAPQVNAGFSEAATRVHPATVGFGPTIIRLRPVRTAHARRHE